MKMAIPVKYLCLFTETHAMQGNAAQMNNFDDLCVFPVGSCRKRIAKIAKKKTYIDTWD